MLGWLGDLGRLSWGLLYWNLRKALYRARGARGAAPCQHPSDSGLAGRTACEACRGWRDDRRFRRLCPLLATTAQGRRVCSVDAADVRPFWGRAALIYGAGAAALALASILAAFAAFRAIGYRVSLSTVAWPPAWHRIEKARADYFYSVALRSFAAADVHRSLLALGQVHALDPENTDAAVLLAQFTQITDPEFSDEIYAQVVSGRRGDFQGAAQAWFRALLSRADFRAAARLSARMLLEDDAHAPAWAQGLLFAERMSGDTGPVDRLLEGSARVPDEARAALTLARDLRSGGDAERTRVVQRHLLAATAPFDIYYSLTRAIEIGRASDVMAFLGAPGSTALRPYDREALKLDACSALGWRDLEVSEIGLILDQGTSPASVTLVAAHLVRRPDAAVAARVLDLLGARPLAAAPENAGAHVALLCMAGVNGLDAGMTREADIVGRIVGGPFPAWEHVREFFRAGAPARSPAAVLPVLGQLPLEMVYAILGHYRAAAPQPAPPPGA